MGEGEVMVNVIGDPGLQLSEMNQTIRKLEALFQKQANVDTVDRKSVV